MKPGTPLPAALSGNTIERLIRIDEALIYLIGGALEYLTDRERLEETGALTVEDARTQLANMLWDYYHETPTMTLVGAVQMWMVSTIPDGWLLLDGTPTSRVDYPELFDLWGTTFGTGDGSTTFDIPNMIGRSPIGAGTVITPAMVIGLGAAFGSYEHTLTTAEMPSHAHRMPKQSATVNAAVNVSTPAARTDNPATPVMMTDPTGGGLPHNNIHPVWGVNYIVYAGA